MAFSRMSIMVTVVLAMSGAAAMDDSQMPPGGPGSMGDALKDPAVLKQAMEMMQNPLVMQQCLHAWPLRWTPRGSPQKWHHGPYRLRFDISTCGGAV